MPSFHYRALQANGVVIEGHLDAASRQEACRQLDTRNLIPVNVKAETGVARGFAFSLPLLKPRSVSHRALHDFTHMLSSLLSAGVSLSRALQILSSEISAGGAGDEWKKLRERVVDGWSLADAMAHSPETFSDIYVAMVRAGEAGGFLEVVLEQITELQERDRELRGRVMSAMIYPAILVVLAIGVLIFLLVFFIPRFELIFAGFDATLPLLTRMIVGASKIAQDYGALVAAAAIAAGFALRSWHRSERGRRLWSQIVLRSPVIGPLQARFAMSRFCRMLGTLIGSGVPLLDALRIARESIGNPVLTDTVTEVAELVQQGSSLAAGLKKCPAMFPSSVIEMVTVAEETGRLDQEFMRIAGNAEKDLDRRLRNAVALAEPLILFLIATIVGVIFIGMVVPIFSLQDYIK